VSICDINLSADSGSVADRQRQLANRILNAQRQAGREWTPWLHSFLPTPQDLTALPDGSWLLQIHFRLSRPFASKAESEFHPWEERVVDKKDGATDWFEIQNPIVRDHLTGLPMVRATTWKGHLRFAGEARALDGHVRDRLFGVTRGNAEGQSGRLHFFPTFFADQTGQEVATPLSRDTRTPVPGRGPVSFEVVQAGEKGEGKLILLYVPTPKGAGWHPRQIGEDLVAAASAVAAMLLDYGFSAKKTAGWGVAEDGVLFGKLAAKGAMWPAEKAAAAARHQFIEPEGSFRKFMDERGQPHAALKKPAGQWLSNQEFKTAGAGLGTLTEYKRFRAWYETHGTEWVRRLTGPQQRGGILLHVFEFPKISELPALATRLVRGLKEASGD
jgi:CRISPR-associated protein Cmr2